VVLYLAATEVIVADKYPGIKLKQERYMLERMIGAARLNAHTFEEVENDNNATTQAMLVVVIVSIAAAIGGLLALGGNPITGLIFGVIRGLLGWALWALVTYFVGTTIFNTPNTHANWGQLARGTGFAQTPGVLQIFAFIPFLGGAIAVVASVWQLVAMVIAVRQSLDYSSTWRAVGVVLVGFVIVIIPLLILGAILGGRAG
jgi:hypothetical protein